MPRPSATLPCLGLAATLAAGLGVPLAPAWAKAANDPTFEVVNHGDSAIVELYATPAGRANWGRNRLNGRTLAPHAGFTVRPPADGNCIFDLRAVFADHRSEEQRGLNVCQLDQVAVGGPEHREGGTIKTAPNDPSFRLVNRGQLAVAELFATPSGMNHWGQNRLPEGGLPAGAAETIRIPATGECFYDLRVVLANGKSLVKRRDNLCRVSEVPVP
jgi:hypothetical protein